MRPDNYKTIISCFSTRLFNRLYVIVTKVLIEIHDMGFSLQRRNIEAIISYWFQ